MEPVLPALPACSPTRAAMFVDMFARTRFSRGGASVFASNVTCPRASRFRRNHVSRAAYCCCFAAATCAGSINERRAPWGCKRPGRSSTLHSTAARSAARPRTHAPPHEHAPGRPLASRAPVFAGRGASESTLEERVCLSPPRHSHSHAHCLSAPPQHYIHAPTMYEIQKVRASHQLCSQVGEASHCGLCR